MEHLRIVLVRPRNPENLGAVARAMRNFELRDWAIVELGTHDFATARRVAVHAEELLDRPRLCATLDEAVADCAWVVGTSGRTSRGRRRLEPEEVGREAGRLRPGRTAIVFGEERSGLTGAELDRCHALSAIPTGEEQPSLNLAQAVLLYAWEARCAVAAAAPARPSGTPATDAQLQAVEAALRSALRAGGFLVGPERHAVRDLVDVLRRGRPTPKEARLWETALRSMGKRGPERFALPVLFRLYRTVKNCERASQPHRKKTQLARDLLDVFALDRRPARGACCGQRLLQRHHHARAAIQLRAVRRDAARRRPHGAPLRRAARARPTVEARPSGGQAELIAKDGRRPWLSCEARLYGVRRIVHYKTVDASGIEPAASASCASSW